MAAETNANDLIRDFVRSTLFVIVVYKQALDECESYRSLNASLAAYGLTAADVFVQDNSPSGSNRAGDLPPSIRYLHDASNPGVSKAYNRAAEYAQTAKKKWLLLLDQDTHLPVETVARYADAAHNDSTGLLAPRLWESGRLFSPCRYYFGRGFPLGNICSGEHALRHRNLLNSGLCVSTHLFRQTGGYDEAIPLYFSDFEFVNRVRMLQPTFRVVDLDCRHTLADVHGRDVAAALRRFEYYAAGAAASAKTIPSMMMLWIGVALRAAKLSVRFRKPRFLWVPLKNFRRAA
jgi:GT2 family glycosyltransferase